MPKSNSYRISKVVAIIFVAFGVLISLIGKTIGFNKQILIPSIGYTALIYILSYLYFRYKFSENWWQQNFLLTRITCSCSSCYNWRKENFQFSYIRFHNHFKYLYLSMMSNNKDAFLLKLKDFAKTLTEYVSTEAGEWSIKGFIDVEEQVYTISSDSKIISKILEIQLFPKFKDFASKNGYNIVLAEKQNWYPDLSFVNKKNSKIKFAVDIKTTYRLEDYDGFCNGFTLGSHGEYFRKRTSTKNIQFPYAEYEAHFCLGILYTRALSTDIDETEILKLADLDKITSVIKDFTFFAEEKWKISSDKGGSGNTANIGSIHYIEDIIKGNGVFTKLGEKWFDEYWIDFGHIDQKDENGKPVLTPKGKNKKITDIETYLKYRGESTDLINPRKNKKKNKKSKK